MIMMRSNNHAKIAGRRRAYSRWLICEKMHSRNGAVSWRLLTIRIYRKTADKPNAADVSITVLIRLFARNFEPGLDTSTMSLVNAITSCNPNQKSISPAESRKYLIFELNGYSFAHREAYL